MGERQAEVRTPLDDEALAVAAELLDVPREDLADPEVEAMVRRSGPFARARFKLAVGQLGRDVLGLFRPFVGAVVETLRRGKGAPRSPQDDRRV